MIDVNTILDDINPMDWHQLRLLNFVPEHFVQLELREDIVLAQVLDWVIKNTSGRVGFGVKATTTNVSYVIQKHRLIGFENPTDATLFSLFF